MESIDLKGLKKKEKWFKNDEYFTEVFNALMSDWNLGKEYHGRELYCSKYEAEFVLAILLFLYHVTVKCNNIKFGRDIDLTMPINYNNNCTVSIYYKPNIGKCIVDIDHNMYFRRYFEFIVQPDRFTLEGFFLQPSSSDIMIDNTFDKDMEFEKNFINILLDSVYEYILNIRKGAII